MFGYYGVYGPGKTKGVKRHSILDGLIGDCEARGREYFHSKRSQIDASVNADQMLYNVGQMCSQSSSSSTRARLESRPSS